MKAFRKLSVFLPVFFSALFLCSCLSHEVAVNTLQPGIAPFSDHIQRFVLLDLTGKRHESLCALQIGLIKDSSYSSLIHKNDTGLRSVSPESLSWEKVAAILRNDTTAGLIVLEKTGTYMRTDPTVVTTTHRRVYNYAGQYEGTVISTQYLQELYYTYQWKIYDLKSKTIFGSFHYEYPDSSSWRAGTAFANQLLPHTKWISRKYYVNGGKNMRSAGFLVRKGQWAKACAMWEREAKKGSRRAQRKAYYNLAIAQEKAGNLPLAIEYARKAKQLGEPEAEFYLLILQNEQKVLK